MTFIFYDTETTGLQPAFDQILQFGAVATDDDFQFLEELNLRCRLQPHIVPSPGAMLITGVGPKAIAAAPYSCYEMVRAIRQFILKWSPATLIGFNSIDFDEKMLRQAFYQSLHPVYLTSINGNSRMDVLRLAHAVAEHQPDAINVPLNDKGNPSFRLVHLVEANGLALGQAHDALADTRATLELARYLRARAPKIWDLVYSCRSRRGVEALLEKEDIVLFTDRNFSKPTVVAGFICRHPTNQASMALFDLACDPSDFLDVDEEHALSILKSSPRPIRIVRANALPLLSPIRSGTDAAFDLGMARERLSRIRTHPTFRGTIAKAMAHQFADAKPSPYVEQHIYDGFPTARDQRLMDAFHVSPWARRAALVAQFEDKRLRELGERLIYIERPEVLPDTRRAELDGWRRGRQTAASDAPWLTLAGARRELAEMRAGGLPFDAALADEIEHYLICEEQALQINRSASAETADQSQNPSIESILTE